MKEYKLIIFDMDGTLADRDTGDLLEGVEGFFEDFYDKEIIAIVATNQGGVGLRHWMEVGGFGEPEKYPERGDIRVKLNKLVEKLPMLADIMVCYAYLSKKGVVAPVPDKYCLQDEWNLNFRKPNPGMLMKAMQDWNKHEFETLMVGDRPEDEEAAKRAGCDFMWAWEFFGRDEPDES